MIVTVKRQDGPDTAPYFQRFLYDGDPNVTVAAVLDYLNYHDDPVDLDGHPARRIRWECGCLQKMCGGCAMVINHVPALACNVFLRDLRGDALLLEPLSKFPVVCDLVTDRSIIHENLKRADAYIHGSAAAGDAAAGHSYLAAKCLKCGLCLEICPNYHRGETFFGAQFANDSYLLRTLSGDPAVVTENYREHFAKGCSKALSCRDVCPVHIPVLSSMAKMNARTFKKIAAVLSPLQQTKR